MTVSHENLVDKDENRLAAEGRQVRGKWRTEGISDTIKLDYSGQSKLFQWLTVHLILRRYGR